MILKSSTSIPRETKSNINQTSKYKLYIFVKTIVLSWRVFEEVELNPLVLYFKLLCILKICSFLQGVKSNKHLKILKVKEWSDKELILLSWECFWAFICDLKSTTIRTLYISLDCKIWDESCFLFLKNLIVIVAHNSDDCWELL